MLSPLRGRTVAVVLLWANDGRLFFQLGRRRVWELELPVILLNAYSCMTGAAAKSCLGLVIANAKLFRPCGLPFQLAPKRARASAEMERSVLAS